MAYPTTMLWGAGRCRFYLQGTADLDSGTVDLSTKIDAMLVPREVRTDGGALRMMLDDGTEVYRGNGFRIDVRLHGVGLTSAEVVEVMRVINYAKRGGRLYCQPHTDVNYKTQVNPPIDIPVTHTGEMYVGHDIDLTFTGANVRVALPLSAADGDDPPTLDIFTQVG
jgi:hypothetical protein